MEQIKKIGTGVKDLNKAITENDLVEYFSEQQIIHTQNNHLELDTGGSGL
jgi:hypothetical protein